MKTFLSKKGQIAALALGSALVFPAVQDGAVAASTTMGVTANLDKDTESVTVTGEQAPRSLLNPGVSLDGVAGVSLVRGLERTDVPYALLALGQSLSGPLDEWVEWRSARAGVEGRFRPTREFRDSERLCRDFTAESSGGQARDIVMGTACQNADGVWVLR